MIRLGRGRPSEQCLEKLDFRKCVPAGTVCIILILGQKACLSFIKYQNQHFLRSFLFLIFDEPVFCQRRLFFYSKNPRDIKPKMYSAIRPITNCFRDKTFMSNGGRISEM